MTYQRVPIVNVWVQGRDYLEAAEILLDYNRLQPASILAGLALEIFIKSFLAERDSTGRVTTLYGHDLGKLFHLIDNKMQSELIASSTEIDSSVELENELNKYNSLFTRARYRYEPTAPFSLSSDVIYFARHMCETVFLLGKKYRV
ncbi:hypothetical protein MCAMS1_00087 [biofilm metagenome]